MAAEQPGPPLLACRAVFPSSPVGRTWGCILASPILDERTEQPVNYEGLLDEARKLAEAQGASLPSACRSVAESASPEKAESIERQLRRLRRRRSLAVAAVDDRPPLAGWGAWSQVLGDAAEQLEEQWHRIGDRQHYSAHQVQVYRDRARTIYDIASARLDYLQSTPREEAVRALEPILGSLAGTDSALDPAAFYDAEVRAAEVILHRCSRVSIEADQALEFLR